MMNQLMKKMITYYSGDPMRIQHFIKVHSLSKLIGEEEGLDALTLERLEVAALVHDIGIKEAEKRYGSSNGSLQEALGPDLARQMLSELGYEAEFIERVCYLVGHHHTYTAIEGLDYQILVEADFLVNMYEDELSATAQKKAVQKIFKTKTGIQLAQTMYALT